MDLIFGTGQTFVTKEYMTKTGEPKNVKAPYYPLTGQYYVDHLYTNFCVIHVENDALQVVEIIKGLSFKNYNN